LLQSTNLASKSEKFTRNTYFKIVAFYYLGKAFEKCGKIEEAKKVLVGCRFLDLEHCWELVNDVESRTAKAAEEAKAKASVETEDTDVASTDNESEFVSEHECSSEANPNDKFESDAESSDIAFDINNNAESESGHASEIDTKSDSEEEFDPKSRLKPET